ncbi:MAG: signal peptidase II [Candidatus Muproteobacteria bacterium RBG_16_65_34]|uniref:Lipoprotein signal peptidase n=1 Tax=Candidatus Muproteobacteria bacterium RBG_16_65_34 TaxID=1817760 RepID=A0A1F6TJW4_9PROT|nr:MAG: signal peptidase II [Candidatus Muproteobacteria bacterium RBG_16_65_34]
MMRWLWISALVLVLDQASKYAAVGYLAGRGEVEFAPFLNLALVYNRGAAFGFLSAASGWQNLFFIAVASIAAVVIVLMLRRLGDKDKLVATGLSLILGGALGNLLDRLIHGSVIDFIDVYYPRAGDCLWLFVRSASGCHWPTFNIADSAITIGAALLILDALVAGRRAHGART